MAGYAAQARPAGWLRIRGLASQDQWAIPDVRRKLQLALAGIWLLDGLLQFQAFMFTKGFAQMLAGTAPGNPSFIAEPITWAARIISDHATAANTAFAFIQVLLGLGIALRPTIRIALGASIAWAIAVWWFGEGLGGILNGGASPANGAPGAVIIYALLAVLLWPPRHERPASFVAGRSTGPVPAKVLWLVLWGSLAYMALLPATRAPKALSSMISGMASGQPGWLAGADNHLASFLASRGGAAAVVLAVILAVIALGVLIPSPAAVKAVLALAIITAAALWVAQGLGGILAGGATDPNSGPLLALLALCYWPLASRRQPATESEAA
jgi:hypothetical protein